MVGTGAGSDNSHYRKFTTRTCDRNLNNNVGKWTDFGRTREKFSGCIAWGSVGYVVVGMKTERRAPKSSELGWEGAAVLSMFIEKYPFFLVSVGGGILGGSQQMGQLLRCKEKYSSRLCQ